VQDWLKKLHADLEAGLTKGAPSNYTLRAAAQDWLASGLTGSPADGSRSGKRV